MTLNFFTASEGLRPATLVAEPGWQVAFRYLSSVRLEPKELCGASQKIRVGTRCAGDIGEGRIRAGCGMKAELVQLNTMELVV